MKEVNLKDIDPIKDLKNNVWRILDSFRHELIDAVNYPFILFLLSLQKDGFLNDIKLSELNNLKEDVRNVIGKLDTETGKIYKTLLDFYQPLINPISDSGFSFIIQSLAQLDQTVLKENFGYIFDDILYELSKIGGKSVGEVILPMELSRFMSGLAQLDKNAEVYNPFGGLASFGVFLDNNEDYLGQEISTTTWAMGSLRIMACNRTGASKFILGDSVNNWNPFKKYKSDKPEDILKYPSESKKYDLIISDPPYGGIRDGEPIIGKFGKIKTYEHFVIEKGIESLKPNGKLITCIPLSILFKSGIEQDLRKYLVENDLLEMIISFPGGLLLNTSIPVVVIVINKEKKWKEKVKFIDASKYIVSSGKREKRLNDYELNSLVNSTVESESLILVSNETILANDYNLNVTRYFVNEYEGVRLGDLGSIILGKRINEFLKEKGRLIRNRDLKSNAIDFILDIENIENVELSRHINSIDESCLLLATRDKHIKPTFFEYKNTPIYLYKGIHAFKVDNSKIDLEYLVSELNSDYVSEQINAWYNRSILPIINLEDLLNIKINLPSLEQQKAKVEGIKQAFLENKRKELAYQQELLGLRDESFREFASIKHTFRQYLNALKSNVAGTKLFVLNNQENGVTLDTLYSKNLNKTFGEHLSGLEGTISSMSKLLSSFETSNENQLVEEYNLIQLVEEAQNRFKNTELFQFDKVYFDTESFTLGDDSVLEPMMSINEDDFYRIFSNIVSNALDHGFKDFSKKYIIRTSISFDENERLCILEVSNNGKAMPKDFTLKDLTTRGEKTTDSKGTGMGGSDIKNILKKYDGVLDLTNEEAEEFPVTYIVKLPLFTLTL